MAQDLAKDFFISYTEPDRQWAEWIAWQLEEAQFSAVLQAWDFLPGANFVQEMDKATATARHTIALLSSSYLQGLYARSEWAVAFSKAKIGEKKALIPVRVSECEITGLLAPIVYIDLVGLSEEIARARLLQSVNATRNKPSLAPAFPEAEKAQLKMLGTPDFPGTASTLWNVPYRRNPFFTDRDEMLALLHDKFTMGRGTTLLQIQAVGGLGGIGKTQIAIEYAYRYRYEYDTVLWIRASTRDTLTADFVAIATLLQLPEKNEQKQEYVVEAVKRWLLIHTRWLLILDDIDELELVHEFLPGRGSGHVLLTTRTQAMSGFAKRVGVDIMSQEDGALFLLRRANIIEPDAQLDRVGEADRAEAIAISRLLHGLPLALDQAGAYIEETASSLEDYTTLYNTQRTALLRERGGFAPDHPEPVATTWSLSFEKLLKTNPAAVELLRFLAFLHPDIIPEVILTAGATKLGPILEAAVSNPFSLNAMIKELLRYSLIRRNPGAKTLTIHRLVQFVLKDEMDIGTQEIWAKRAVQAVNQAFPEVEFATWQRCQHMLPHAQTCALLISQWGLKFSEAARLLHHTGYYLCERGQYTEAEPFLQQSQTMHEQILGTQHAYTAISIHDLGRLYYARWKHVEAETMYIKGLDIREHVLGSEHPSIIGSLNDLATLYRVQRKFLEADQLCQRALLLCQKVLEPEHPNAATSMHNLASLYYDQEKYTQAEALYLQAMKIREHVLDIQHPDIATSLNDLATLYRMQEKFVEAEQHYQRALSLREDILGAKHPDVARNLDDLALLYKDQGKYNEAEPLFLRALAIREKALGPQHPDVATTINNLAFLYDIEKNYIQAEQLYLRALATREQVLGPKHLDTAISLNNLAGLYIHQSKYDQAAPLLERALTIREEVLGMKHRRVATSLNNLADLYLTQRKYTFVEPLLQRSLIILEQEYGTQYPQIAVSLMNLAQLYQAQLKYSMAETFYQRALKIHETTRYPKYALIIQNLRNLAELYHEQSEFSKAEQFYKQALAMSEQEPGPQNTDLISVLESYIIYLKQTERIEETEKAIYYIQELRKSDI